MRYPVAQGFYPWRKDELLRMLEDLFKKSEKMDIGHIIGGVVPHAGYMYSGLTAAHFYKNISDSYDVVIILGTNHTGLGEKAAISREPWETPLGVVEVDLELADALLDTCTHMKADELAHLYEHSIEVQLPFLQYRLGDFRFVPIAIMSNSNPAFYTEIGNAIKTCTKGLNALIIASSDFTHFGEGYGFVPTNGDPVEWVRKTDLKAVDAILKLDDDEFLNIARTTTICGSGAIATLINTMKGMNVNGKLLHYSTSYDVSRNKDMIVGYASVGFVREGKQRLTPPRVDVR